MRRAERGAAARASHPWALRPYHSLPTRLDRYRSSESVVTFALAIAAKMLLAASGENCQKKTIHGANLHPLEDACYDTIIAHRPRRSANPSQNGHSPRAGRRHQAKKSNFAGRSGCTIVFRSANLGHGGWLFHISLTPSGLRPVEVVAMIASQNFDDGCFRQRLSAWLSAQGVWSYGGRGCNSVISELSVRFLNPRPFPVSTCCGQLPERRTFVLSHAPI